MLVALFAGVALSRHFEGAARSRLTRQAILNEVGPRLAARKRHRGEDLHDFVDRARDSASLGRLWYDPTRQPQVWNVSVRGFGHSVVARVETGDGPPRYFKLRYSSLHDAWQCSESWESHGLEHPEREGFGLLGRFFPRTLPEAGSPDR